MPGGRVRREGRARPPTMDWLLPEFGLSPGAGAPRAASAEWPGAVVAPPSLPLAAPQAAPPAPVRQDALMADLLSSLDAGLLRGAQQAAAAAAAACDPPANAPELADARRRAGAAGARESRALRRREFHKIHTRRSRAKLNDKMERLLAALPPPPAGVAVKSKAQILDYAIAVLSGAPPGAVAREENGVEGGGSPPDGDTRGP